MLGIGELVLLILVFLFAGGAISRLARWAFLRRASGAKQVLWVLADWIKPGTHITAMGSDTPTKQELDSSILAKADLVVADSISQCVERGEISHALKDGKLAKNDIVELGHVLNGQNPGRTSSEQLTVADLTGVAVQDIQIATAVYESYLEKQS